MSSGTHLLATMGSNLFGKYITAKEERNELLKALGNLIEATERLANKAYQEIWEEYEDDLPGIEKENSRENHKFFAAHQRAKLTYSKFKTGKI